MKSCVEFMDVKESRFTGGISNREGLVRRIVGGVSCESFLVSVVEEWDSMVVVVNCVEEESEKEVWDCWVGYEDDCCDGYDDDWAGYDDDCCDG